VQVRVNQAGNDRAAFQINLQSVRSGLLQDLLICPHCGELVAGDGNGFGGFRLTDCVKLLDRLVIKYRPRTVMLYAGDNDLAEGSTPEDVLNRVKAFTDGVHSRLPETQVTFISIKPSPARRALVSKARAANKLVQAYAAVHPKVDYIDVFTPMLAADGSPRGDLFRKDALHLNEAGYALWRSIIRPFVR